MTMMGSIPIPNTRFYLTSIDGKKWFVSEYYRTAPFNPDKETYTYPQDGPWYELKYIADELPNSLEAEISGGNQLIMNYEQAQELFGIKFRRWLGIFNL